MHLTLPSQGLDGCEKHIVFFKKYFLLLKKTQKKSYEPNVYLTFYMFIYYTVKILHNISIYMCTVYALYTSQGKKQNFGSPKSLPVPYPTTALCIPLYVTISPLQESIPYILKYIYHPIIHCESPNTRIQSCPLKKVEVFKLSLICKFLLNLMHVLVIYLLRKRAISYVEFPRACVVWTTHSAVHNIPLPPAFPENWQLDHTWAYLILLAKLQLVIGKATIIMEAQIVPLQPVGTSAGWFLSPFIITLKAFDRFPPTW